MPMTFEDWSKLVRAHDLTYAYSDDHSVWSNGQAQRDLIMREAVNFPLPDVIRVWNTELVDKFLIPEARAEFYWRDEPSLRFVSQSNEE